MIKLRLLVVYNAIYAVRSFTHSGYIVTKVQNTCYNHLQAVQQIQSCRVQCNRHFASSSEDDVTDDSIVKRVKRINLLSSGIKKKNVNESPVVVDHDIPAVPKPITRRKKVVQDSNNDINTTSLINRVANDKSNDDFTSDVAVKTKVRKSLKSSKIDSSLENITENDATDNSINTLSSISDDGKVTDSFVRSLSMAEDEMDDIEDLLDEKLSFKAKKVNRVKCMIYFDTL